MAAFVLDEWLWADLSGENGSDKQGETEALLFAIYEICDRIVLVKGSRFEDKTVAFWNHSDTRRRRIARFYRDTFPFNTNKSHLLDQDELPALPDELAREIESNDRYLVQAQRAVPESVIVTTDGPLTDVCAKQHVPCQPRDNFVREYLTRHRGAGGQESN